MIPPPTLPVKVPASASGNSDFKQANSGFTCIFYSKVYNYSMNGKKLRNLAKTFGNLFVDLGKLSFGSLMLGTLLKGGVDLLQLFYSVPVLPSDTWIRTRMDLIPPEQSGGVFNET
jgi:hypothetical protein